MDRCCQETAWFGRSVDGGTQRCHGACNNLRLIIVHRVFFSLCFHPSGAQRPVARIICGHETRGNYGTNVTHKHTTQRGKTSSLDRTEGGCEVQLSRAWSREEDAQLLLDIKRQCLSYSTLKVSPCRIFDIFFSCIGHSGTGDREESWVGESAERRDAGDAVSWEEEEEGNRRIDGKRCIRAIWGCTPPLYLCPSLSPSLFTLQVNMHNQCLKRQQRCPVPLLLLLPLPRAIW